MNRRNVLKLLPCTALPALSCGGAARMSQTPGIRPTVSGDTELQFIGSIPGIAAGISPGGITAGLDGSLYVCDRGKAQIVRIDTTGRVLARFEGFDSRTDKLFLPIDISVSGGIEVYVLDSAGSRVFRLDRNLKNAYAVYRADPGEEQRFGTFGGILFDTQSGDIYITDRDRGAIIRIDMLGGTVQTSGRFGTGRQSLQKPAGLDRTPDGSLVIADAGRGALALLPHFGESITFIGDAVLEAPVDVTVLSPGRYAAADRRGIVLLGRDGIVHAVAGFDTTKEMSPRSVTSFNDVLFVSDSISSSVLMYRVSPVKKQ